MRFQVASTIVATCIAIATAKTEAEIFAASTPKIATTGPKKTRTQNNAPPSKLNLAEILGQQTVKAVALEKPAEKKKPTKRRLLHTLQKRKEKAYQRHLMKQNAAQSPASAQPDVGILSSSQSTIPRFLADYDYYCPEDTCPKELCDCANAGGSLEDCSTELQNVCASGRLQDCVFEEYVPVYQEVYCPWTMCLDGGFRVNQCDCAFYEMYCNRLNGEECEDVIKHAADSDEEDKKPFFGCDEAEMKDVCDQAKVCKERGDLNGLPDLGTWQGTGVVGIQKAVDSGSERLGSGGVLAGVTIISYLLYVMNA
mmetsp:Transcript_8821/g.18349  ORF Transcript_8821/g.18349 Transcript_8821/m.18349 type:complete len:311 (+) Transcript_8821:148-1080(+)